MGRPMLDPASRKKSISFALTPEQRQLAPWVAQQTGETPSAMVGRLIEAEAKKIAKKTGKEPPKVPDPQQLQWTAAGQVEAVASVRDLINRDKEYTVYYDLKIGKREETHSICVCASNQREAVRAAQEQVQEKTGRHAFHCRFKP